MVEQSSFKKFIIDMINYNFFEESLSLEGVDQFNEMFLIESEEDNDGDDQIRICKRQVRGGYFVNNWNPFALRILISVEKDSSTKVCYRITPIKDKIILSDTDRIILPPENIVVDFSIADLNVGVADLSSYSFYDNIRKTGNIQPKKLLNFINLLMNSKMYSIADDRESFEDLLDAQESYPPIAGDVHYSPVYGKQDV